MRKNFGPNAWLYPMPVLMIASYGSDGTPNLMNAAWGGISGEHQISICVAAEHKTTENILAKKAFTVSVADAAHVTACDYSGIVSGTKVPDKVAKAGLHTEKSAFVDAPVICELPLALECRMVSYNRETNILVGDIVNVSAAEEILDAQGKVDPEKLDPITFDPVHMVYRRLGSVTGRAFHDGAALR